MAGSSPAMTNMAIRVTDEISIDESEIEESFVRSSGPGGQNVNKLATAVQLRFDVRRSPSLPEPVRQRLEQLAARRPPRGRPGPGRQRPEQLAGRRLTGDGVLIITAQRHRAQERNREDAQERLLDLIRRAAEPPPPPRRPTRPSKGARERRLGEKARRGQVKSLRGRHSGED